MKLVISFNNMISRKLSSIYLGTWFFALFICFVSPSGLINNGTHSPASTVRALNSDTSQNGPGTHSHMGASNISRASLNLTTHKSTKINTDKPRPSNATNFGKTGATIPVEGGVILVPDISRHKISTDNNTTTTNNKKHKTVSHKMVTDTINQGNNTVHDNKTIVLPSLSNVTSSEAPKSIHSIENVKTSSPPYSHSSTIGTTKKHKMKPLFTMVPSDESKGSDSFIESSTTGRDYVLPIVLIILALPLVGYIIKLIYRRGTEFTERQQYHRMYLIDGMYNTR